MWFIFSVQVLIYFLINFLLNIATADFYFTSSLNAAQRSCCVCAYLSGVEEALLELFSSAVICVIVRVVQYLRYCISESYWRHATTTQ